jgi:transposase-like protein
MNKEIRQRLKWIQYYESCGNAGLTCRRFGISRSTLRKWLRRYEEEGLEDLSSRSHRPLNSPNAKIGSAETNLIIDLRISRNLGARRVQSELKRLNNLSLSLATIHKVLKQNQVKPLRRVRRKPDYIRYERPIPGDRYNRDRSHGAHHGKTPMEKYFELSDQTPFSDEVSKN